MKHFLSVCLLFLAVHNDLVKLGHFGALASNVDFIPRTIRRTRSHYEPNVIEEDSSNVNLLAVLFGDEFQVLFIVDNYRPSVKLRLKSGSRQFSDLEPFEEKNLISVKTC